MGAAGKAVTLYVDAERSLVKKLAKTTAGQKATVDGAPLETRLLTRKVPHEQIQSWASKVR